MGVLNVTPDSFSDGGAYASASDAVAAGLRLVADGADLVDVGGESTRPGAQPVSVAEEMRRVLPVVEGLSKAGIIISIDTRHADVAEAALHAGAAMVNDVSSLGDPRMVEVVSVHDAHLCLMHMQGTPQTMQDDPRYEDVVADIGRYLASRRDSLLAAGIPRERICLDPGVGFGQTHRHSVELGRAASGVHLGGRSRLRPPR